MSNRGMADRPRNPYLTPLQLVSSAYFLFLGGVALASAALAALAALALFNVITGNWHGRRGYRPILAMLFLILISILISAHIVLGLLTLFRRVEEKDELEIELPDKWQR